jgi:hypothetical protein
MGRRNLCVCLSICVAVQIVLCLSANAAPISQVFKIPDRNSTAYCGLTGTVWEPVTKVQGTYRVVTLQIKDLKRRIAKASGSTKTSLQRKLKLLVSLRARTLSTCRQGIPPTPYPTPSATVAPPTPTISTICFVSGGDTKPGCFGIPAPLIGNDPRGASLYQQQCYGCHRSSKSAVAYNYTKLQSTFDRIPQMAPYRPAPQQLADLVAYVNRFNF